MKNKIVLSLLTLFLGLLIYSCRKEFYSSEDIKPTEKLSVKEARAFFKKSGLQTKSAASSSGTNKNGIRPFWHKAMQGSTASSSFVEVPLQTPGLTFTLFAFDNNGTPTAPDKSVSNYVFKRLVMYKDISGTIVSRVLTYVPEKSYLEKNKFDATGAKIRALNGFSGYIQVHTIENEPISVYKYQNGRILMKVKLFKQHRAENKSATGVKTKGWEVSCSPIYAWICVGGEGGLSDSPGGSEPVCTPQYVGEDCVSTWVPDPPVPTDPNEPGENENPTVDTSQPDYELPRDIKLDSLNKKFPCVVKTIINALKANPKFYALVQPFDEIHLPNGQKLTVQGVPNLQFDAKPLTWGTADQYKLGETGRTNGNVGGSVIVFNSSAINNASKLMIQTTAIHEAGHAYANYYIKYGSWGYPVDTARYSTWALDIVNFQSASRDQKNNPNFYDHSTFLENYFDNMVSILKDINGSTYTDKQYRMAALYGMDNAGERPAFEYPINGVSHYDILRTALLASFEAIKTKYSITTADLTAFNQANILNVPNNQKVPTNCP